ncbi:aspartic peptidase domain-containing protein [Aspergillus multicolor]|uniref:aspartic peptidase domain-containing protein n=1 Tax=Aspergillus multicolor TaxID=41759 RepID=UPI003CCD2F54
MLSFIEYVLFPLLIGSSATTILPLRRRTVFDLLVDSGSSDLYVMENGFTCLDKDTEGFTVAGVTILRTHIVVADKSTPMGDGVNSGLLGLGYPSLTSAYPSNVTDDPTYSATPVEIMNNILQSFASNRRTSSYWATTLAALLGQNSTRRARNISTATSISAPFQAFFDFGNLLSYIPARLAEPLNALLSPPGIHNNSFQAYVVDCNAKAPSTFSLRIDGHTFTHNSSGLIYQTGGDLCISAIGNSDELRLMETLYVVLVFDFGKSETRFARLLEDVTDSVGGENGYVPENYGGRTTAAGLSFLLMLGLLS